MQAVQNLSATLPVTRACSAFNLPRASFYRKTKPAQEARPKKASPRALSPAERATVRDTLNSEAFQDKSPYQVYATLLDDKQKYLCSIRTMYRILHENNEVRERRDQLRHPNYRKPELLTTQSNRLWSWDITKLRSPVTWQYYHLYAIMDVFSRFIVGWRVEAREAARLAEELIAETCFKQNIPRDQLTLHADRGTSMTSKTVAQLLLDLGVAKTHSRPHTSNDNPYSEAQFKTMKYRPDYPDRFGSLQDARNWAKGFFEWYNHNHRHSGLALMTPVAVHTGQAATLTDRRKQTLQKAYRQHPERFVNGTPKPLKLPDAVWINKPELS